MLFSPIFVRLSEVDPIMTAFFRIFVSLPFFLMFGSLKIIEKVNFPTLKNKFLIIFISGVFFFIRFNLLAFVYQTYTVSKATFLSNLAPIVVILFSLIFLKEKL